MKQFSSQQSPSVRHCAPAAPHSARPRAASLQSPAACLPLQNCLAASSPQAHRCTTLVKERRVQSAVYHAQLGARGGQRGRTAGAAAPVLAVLVGTALGVVLAPRAAEAASCTRALVTSRHLLCQSLASNSAGATTMTARHAQPSALQVQPQPQSLAFGAVGACRQTTQKGLASPREHAGLQAPLSRTKATGTRQAWGGAHVSRRRWRCRRRRRSSPR